MSESQVHFLIVDDLRENRLSLSALLRRDALVILEAASGEQALELLLTHSVDLAFVDVQMPGMDGFELAEIMRANPRTSQIPIIFVTAGDPKQLKRFRGYQAGAVDYLSKPIEADSLRSKANVFFELAQNKRKLEAQKDALETFASENARLLDETQRYAVELQAMDKRKNEFLATLAHELRNPLAPLQNAVELMRIERDPARGKQALDMIEHQVLQMRRLVDDLLDVARISHGKIELQLERLCLNDIVKIAVQTVEPLARSRSQHLHTDFAHDSAWVEGDQTRLIQIAVNLINNAIKYSPEGTDIHIRVCLDDSLCWLEVADEGIGIEPDMLAQVFELFSQVDGAAQSSGGGLGVGLALVKQLAQMHEGVIEAESEGLGKGSTFRIRLPRVAAPVVAAHDSLGAGCAGTDVTSTHTAVTPKRVLVVDDNHDAAVSLGYLLELAGHEYQLAHSGAEALSQAQRFQPEVVLLDIGLPDYDGYEVCRRLRAQPEFATALIVAQTGWGQAQDKARSKAAGFDSHLVKPIPFASIQALLTDDSGST